MFVLSLSLAGCGPGSSVAPEATLPVVTSGVTLQQVLDGFVAASHADALTPMPVGFSEIGYGPGNCAYNAAAKRFACDVTKFGSLTLTPSFTLLDAAGAPMAAFEAARTASVQASLLVVTTFADIVLPSATGTVGWPVAGSISVESTHSAGAGPAPVVNRSTMTFDGTGTVALAILADGTTRRCSLDLARATIVACS